MITHYFTEMEMDFLEHFSEGKIIYKMMRFPNYEHIMFSKNQHRADVIGLMGEHAVCEYLGISPSYSYHMGYDGGVDAVYKGVKLQIKSSGVKGSPMPLDEQLSADAYVFVYCDYDQAIAEMIGFIPSTCIADKRVLHAYPHNIRYVIEQKYLSPISNLK
jgi:hypothetical protein